MADYRTPGFDGLSGYIDRIRREQYQNNPEGSSPLKESLPRNPTQFEEDVRIAYDELMSVLLAKHRDYGARNISDAPGGPLNGLRVRIHDKVARINNLLDKNSVPKYESLEDSFKDLANYAIIALLVLRDKWDK